MLRRLDWAVPLALAASAAVYLAAVARAPIGASFAWLVASAAILGAFLVALGRALGALVGPAPAAAGEGRGRGLSERRVRELEREKALTVRSIKELEFDHRMGKLSDADFAQMGGALRERAVRLMREIDEARRAPPKEGERRAAPGACAACGTANDADAVFCKRCGRRVAEAS